MRGFLRECAHSAQVSDRQEAAFTEKGPESKRILKLRALEALC